MAVVNTKQNNVITLKTKQKEVRVEEKTYNEEEKNFHVADGIHKAIEPLYDLLKEYIEAQITFRLIDFRKALEKNGDIKPIKSTCESEK